MPKKIGAELDKQILATLALGVPNKEIAIQYGVSPSYVSKLKRGKKHLHVAPDITPLRKLSDEDIIEYAESQINHHTYMLRVFKEILNKYKGE